MRRYCLMLAALVGSGLMTREATADAWPLSASNSSAALSAMVVADDATPAEASETIVYDDGVFAPTQAVPPVSYGALSGYAGFADCGTCCEPPCVSGFGRCLEGLRRCCERIKAGLASLCRPRRAYTTYYYDPACCVPEPTCGVEPSCRFAEPGCGVVEPWCGVEPSCNVEPSCGIVSYYRPLGCGERLRAFCQRVRCRLFGWFRFRGCCPYCGTTAGIEPCVGCSAPAVTTTLPGEPVYEAPPEIDPSEMVPVPSVKLQRPGNAVGSGGDSTEKKEDRVAIGTVRLTLQRLR